ncbi:MAG: PAS domain S-box protein [Dehalococcoidales bacterium]|nr:PAS domain S-box protein [Dehalococcoidales bacterium]
MEQSRTLELGGSQMRRKPKRIVKISPYLWRITAITLACSVVYYLPVIVRFFGQASLATVLNRLHDLYGIDFYAMAFFAPVVYAAYIVGVKGAVTSAIASMLILLPHAIWVDTYPNALFKPAAFTIILSAVGAVVAMLQSSDEQRRRSWKELKCLYYIGKAAEESASLEDFLTSAAEGSRQAMLCPEATRVRITVRDKLFDSVGSQEAPACKIKEDLVVGGEVLGNIEISTRIDPDLKQNHFTKTLAERIGGAIRSIELEKSLQGYYGQLEDMVEIRTRDLEQAQGQLRLLSNAVKSSIDGITIANLDGRITFVNEACQKLWGYNSEELMGTKICLLYSPNDIELVETEVLPVSRVNAWNGELTAVKKDGNKFPVMVTTSPVHDEKGATIAIVGMHRDITETKNIKEKLIRTERLAAVGELASGVGHELRNPLNVIRNCVYLLHMTMAEKADEDVTNTLKLLDKQIDISNRIVTDLLDFTRIRPPTLAAVDLNELVKESLSWIEVPGNVAVATDLDSRSPGIIVDSEQVGRAFTNIISNAVQAISGNGELRISTGAHNGYAWAKFRDTGCGISEENMKKIFEPLFTTKPKGIGLGLAITKRLVEQNSGSIEVESQVARGTTFTIKLPTQKRRN